MGTDTLHNALTRNEAYYLCNAYRYMEGEKLADGIEIEHVAVVPADDINKWIFLHHYMCSGDLEKAMDFYKVPFFDVVLITRCNEGKLAYVDLRAYNNNRQH